MSHQQHVFDSGCSNEPQCFISVNKNRIKSTNGAVYLKNGTEFEIEFHNLTAEIQKAVITINGKRQQHALVLRPGEHFYLDRFMDDKKRLLFDVYTVDDVAEVKKAIENNGTVKVEFYREKPKPLYYQQPYIPYILTTTTTYPTWSNYRGGGYLNCGGSEMLTKGISAQSFSAQSYCSEARGARRMSKSIVPDSANFSNTANCSAYGEERADASMNFAEASAEPAKLETGRVEQGSQSDQDFRTVNYDFEYLANKVVEFKLLPISQQKNVSTKQLRSYCNCGRRIKKGWNVCPGCGQNLRSV